MIPIRVIAISTEVAETVRRTNQSPRYGHPAHIEVACGYGPCHHCLQAFKKGREKRTLFTYDAFDRVDSLPLPGPVFIHPEECARYREDGGYPEDLRQYSSVLDPYAAKRHLVAQVQVDDVEYVHVRDKNAGCYDFRLEIARP
jgi:hypothetical protein